MKRVVSSATCDKYQVYIARIKKDKWAMFSEMPDRHEYRLRRLYDSTEYAYGNPCQTLQSCISNAILNGWEVYEFDTFRSAMEYYLEQSK